MTSSSQDLARPEKEIMDILLSVAETVLSQKKKKRRNRRIRKVA
ncbi:hypothetical protein [Pseudomonas oryzihabitans]|nr:hypothetical protein [Pseudomonas oryzihabitans]MDT3723008.1 hypothetical protein [Pseudomonas oryzihabitans]